MATIAQKLNMHPEIKMSAHNRELVMRSGLTLETIELDVGRAQPGTIVSADKELFHKFKDEDERHDFMKELETNKNYFVGIKQKKKLFNIKLRFW